MGKETKWVCMSIGVGLCVCVCVWVWVWVCVCVVRMGASAGLLEGVGACVWARELPDELAYVHTDIGFVYSDMQWRSREVGMA